MPFVALVVGAFVIAMFYDKRATRQTYVMFALAAIAATVYFLR